MLRHFDLRSVLLAGAFFALGFLIADRRTRVEASPAAATQENTAPSFSGTDGAVVMKVSGVPHLIIVRGANL